MRTPSLRIHDGATLARYVYGTIVVLGITLVLEEHPPGPFLAAGIIAFELITILAAEAAAEILGGEIQLRRPLTTPEKMEKVRQLSGVLIAVELPLLFLLLAGAGAFSEQVAFDIIQTTGVALLFCYGFLARRASGRAYGPSVVAGVALASVGIVLGLVKSLH